MKRRTTQRVTFGRFEGPAREEGVKDIYLDGVYSGWIERNFDGAWDGTVVNNSPGHVVSYSVELYDEELQGNFDGREFEKLSDALRAVKVALVGVA